LLLNCYRAIHSANVTEKYPDDPRSIGRVVFFVELGASYLFDTGTLADRTISKAAQQLAFGELRRHVRQDKPFGAEATTTEPAGAALVTAEVDKAAGIHSRDLQLWNAADAQAQVCRLLLSEGSAKAAAALSPSNKYGFDLWNHKEFRTFVDTWEDREFNNQEEVIAFMRAFIEPRRKAPDEHRELLIHINLRCQLAFSRMYEDVISKVLSARPVREKLSKRSLQYNLLAHAMQDVMLTGLVPALHPFWLQALESAAFIGQIDRALADDTLDTQRGLAARWVRLLLLYQSLIHTEQDREHDRRRTNLPNGEEPDLSQDARDMLVTLTEVIHDDEGLTLFYKNKIEGVTLRELADQYQQSQPTLSRRISSVEKSIQKAFRDGNLSPEDFIPATSGDSGRVSRKGAAADDEASNTQLLAEKGRNAFMVSSESTTQDTINEDSGTDVDEDEAPAETVSP
jgi:hypothetical protein